MSKWTIPRVKITAMGSLLPDSNSRRSLTLPFKRAPLELIIENTAAASVDDTMAPTRSEFRKGTSKAI